MANESTLIVKVEKKTIEALDICSFELVSTDAKPLPSFSAGSHIDVQIKSGLTRQYSLCNHPNEQHRYQIAVLRDPQSRGGSAAMHDDIHEGSEIQISPPKNHFPLAHDAKHSILLAGGIGVTPVLCMAERLANIGASFEMHYSARAEDRAAFRQRLLQCSFAKNVYFHFDDGAPEQKLDLTAVLDRANENTHLYVCGPGGFIDYVLATARGAKFKPEQIHFEHFGAKELDTSHDQSFKVKVASSGATFLVPAEKSIATVLSENGIEIPLSCEQGVCGTCITRVLSGIPEHRDLYFSDEEHAKNDQFTPCCSRSKSSELVLDL
jgi:vanillate monooxygenase ferredoxin subunit